MGLRLLESELTTNIPPNAPEFPEAPEPQTQRDLNKHVPKGEVIVPLAPVCHRSPSYLAYNKDLGLVVAVCVTCGTPYVSLQIQKKPTTGELWTPG